MRTSICLLISIQVILLSFNNCNAIDVLVQSHIKGALMGAALGDAYARVATNRSNLVDLLKPITSFKDFSIEDWVYDSKKVGIGIGTENTLILMNQLESLIEGRRLNYSPKRISDLCSKSLTKLLSAASSDCFYNSRHFTPKNKGEVDAKVNARALVRALPVGIVFLDNLEYVERIADLQIQLTDNNPLTRITGIVLAVGLACSTRGDSIEKVISIMTSTAEKYETMFKLKRLESRPSEYIRNALKKAESGAKPKEVLGTRIGYKTLSGSWQGYKSAEVLGGIIYCLMRYDRNFGGSLMDSVHAGGDNELYATLVGALAGSQAGFWLLKKEGYEQDIEHIEKINVLQGVCNDAYVVLSDYPYTGSVK